MRSGTGPAPPAAVVVLTGPTAGGKSRLALEIAERFPATVINADSMQVYRDLRILTARPDAAASARAPHRLYGFLDAAERCSAGRWRGEALAAIAEARRDGRLPLIVGGTGLYIGALARGLAPLPEVPEAVRAAAIATFERLGPAGFHAALAARDPMTAARLHPNDRQRLIRGWEILEATGRSLAEWQQEPAENKAPGPPLRLLQLALVPQRAALYTACDGRFLAMLEAGALDEVRALLERGLAPGLPAMKALGVPELAAHLRGEIGLETAIAAAQQATRRYVKRQLTWLRTQAERNNASSFYQISQLSESTREEIFSKIRQFLLTL